MTSGLWLARTYIQVSFQKVTIYYMSNISWNEIQNRAVQFSAKWEGETYEKGESQSFWSDFLAVFGVDRKRHGAFFEYAIKKINNMSGSH
jgi:hypothetical protein